MATKKTSTKKSTKKVATKTVNPLRGNTYSLTPKGVKELDGSKGQAGELLSALRKAKTATVNQLVAKTNVPKKHVAFYMSVWKHEGYTKFGTKAAA